MASEWLFLKVTEGKTEAPDVGRLREMVFELQNHVTWLESRATLSSMSAAVV